MTENVLFEQLQNLNANELEEVSGIILQMLSHAKGSEITSNSHIETCRKCGGTHITKHGKDRHGKQRYKCASCGCTFTAASYSTISYSHYSEKKWRKYIELLLRGDSLRACSKECNISLPTAFYWRHKILNALQYDQKERKLSGVIEMDDTFFGVSYKGNHKKSKNFVMPRKALKRGTDNTGWINEKVCVMCAEERNGQVYGEVLGIGAANVPKLSYAFDERILDDSICIADSIQTYKTYFKEKPVQLIQVVSPTNKRSKKRFAEKKSAFHIQNVNNFHQRFRKFMRGYNGVATKYLNHYVNLFVWIENHKQMSLSQTMTEYLANKSCYLSARKITEKPALPEVA